MNSQPVSIDIAELASEVARLKFEKKFTSREATGFAMAKRNLPYNREVIEEVIKLADALLQRQVGPEQTTIVA